jgi:ATP-dependent helicase HrpB
LLRERVDDPGLDVVPLYGALDAETQDRAIAPSPLGRRKVVLATSIAETSLTIEGVRIVIDSGLARVPRYEPDVGLTRLEPVRVSRAAADQRRGRAGRTQSGICYRLWDEPQTASLDPYTKPEILAADLSSFALDLAQWGVADPAALIFLDPPPGPALTEAKALLAELGAIDASGRIIAEGRLLRLLPLPPRLARMVVDAAKAGAGLAAAEIAAVLTERGLGGNDVDLSHRLEMLRRDRSSRSVEARAMAERWAALARPASPASGGGVPNPGALLALAYPDRIAKNRGDGNGAFLLANGRGATLDPTSPLARAPFLVVAELTGTAAQGRIVLAAPLTLAEIEHGFAPRIESKEEISFDAASANLRGRRTRRLGAIVLVEQMIPVAAGAHTAQTLADGIVALGLHRLPWSKALLQWRGRVMFLRRAEGVDWPDLSDAALAARAADWLVPLCHDKTSLGQIAAEDLSAALHALMPWSLRKRLDAEAPTHFTAPSGSHVPIDYDAEEGPKLSIRVQELFGLDRHPTLAGGRVPLIVELLSPAQRPVQVTRDLPGFWRGSYAAVKAEMRGRYPKHPWPDDPLSAPATRRAKRSI